MKVGIIGAGATGLTAAYELGKSGHEVTVLERAEELGGLAASITIGGTRLERYYHHLFASDTSAIALIQELGLSKKLIFRQSKTGIFYNGQLHSFSTPSDILAFKPLPVIDRLRFAVSSAYLKALQNWQSLEDQNALQWVRRYAGKRATEVIWEPLLRGKFGEHADDISMSWLWARVHSRTFQLGYLEGGFDQVYERLAEEIKKQGGSIAFGVDIKKISQKDTASPVKVDIANGKTLTFDKLIATVPQPVFAKLIGAKNQDNLWQNQYLGATCFILELKKSFMPYYWLNINDTSFPFLAVVEHTQMVEKRNYGGRHLLYVGNYVPRNDWRFTSEPEQLLQKYIPYLQKINSTFRSSDIMKWQFSKAPFAQPIVTPQYHNHIPPHDTPLPSVKLATMAQVYPQDRGQNYAIKMGQEIAHDIMNTKI